MPAQRIDQGNYDALFRIALDYERARNDGKEYPLGDRLQSVGLTDQEVDDFEIALEALCTVKSSTELQDLLSARLATN